MEEEYTIRFFFSPEPAPQTIAPRAVLGNVPAIAEEGPKVPNPEGMSSLDALQAEDPQSY